MLFISCVSFVSRIMIIYIYNAALYFPFCLSCVLYFYYTFFSIFVTKMERSIKRMRSQSNTKGKGDLGDISKQKMEIFIF